MFKHFIVGLWEDRGPLSGISELPAIGRLAIPVCLQIYTFVLGFVLVFRCNLAYQRFWEGRTCLELMSSKWSDAALQTIIFDNAAEKSEADRLAFRSRMMSLFSLLQHALGNMTRSSWARCVESSGELGDDPIS